MAYWAVLGVECPVSRCPVIKENTGIMLPWQSRHDPRTRIADRHGSTHNRYTLPVGRRKLTFSCDGRILVPFDRTWSSEEASG
jgi:hypothetical protein